MPRVTPFSLSIEALADLAGLRHGDGRLLPGSRVEHNEGHTDLPTQQIRPGDWHTAALMAVARKPHSPEEAGRAMGTMMASRDGE